MASSSVSTISTTVGNAVGLSDRSFARVGALAGVLLAAGSLAAVGVYYTLVPQAQRLPISDPAAYLASLAQDSSGTLLFQGLYAFIAVCALVGILATYRVVRAAGEAWAFFATVVGSVAAALTLVASVFQYANLAYLAAHPALAEQAATTFGAPAPVNPLGVVTFGLTSVWFLVVGLLCLRGPNQPRLLGVLGLVAFADLLFGFVTSVAGSDPQLPLGAAFIAGAVGGPVFWLLLALRLWRTA